MEFTGEQFVPGTPGLEDLYIEHMSRYAFASDIACGRRVLDVGCGSGYGTHLMALRGAELALGIDNSYEAIEFARGQYRHSRLQFAVMNASELGLTQGFDLVTAFEVIGRVKDAPGFLGEIRRVMDDKAVLLVSTPNRAVFVAGSENGKKPPDTRTYDIMGFTELLGSAFPHVRILGQSWVEGMTLVPHPAMLTSSTFRTGKLPKEDGSLPHRIFSCEPPYLIGVCAEQAVIRPACAELMAMLVHSLTSRYDRLKLTVSRPECRLDRRHGWDPDLEEEIRKRDRVIESLRKELCDLRLERDERGRVAKSLSYQMQAKEKATDLGQSGTTTDAGAGMNLYQG